VIRCFERRERVVELAGGLLACGRVAQRKCTAGRGLVTTALGVFLGGRRRGTWDRLRRRVAAKARECVRQALERRGRDRERAGVGGRARFAAELLVGVEAGALEGRLRDLADRFELRIVERGHQLGERDRGDLTLARDDREIDTLIVRQLSGELREPARRGDHLAGIAQPHGDVAQRRSPRRIDLEGALMRGERDVGSAELFL
jgi:hypothetical protein